MFHGLILKGMIYLLRSGEWYRVGHSESRYVVDADENPSLELLGQIPGGAPDVREWTSRMRKMSDDVRGEWFLLKDGGFVEGLVESFSGSEEFASGGIALRYDASRGGAQERIVRLYGQMSSWLEDHPASVSDSALWRSRLLGFCEVLKLMGSSVLSVYPGPSGSLDVRWHDGRVWSPVADVEMRVALQYFCLDDLGVGATEWVRNERKFASALRDGAMMSSLPVSRSVVGFENGVYDFSNPSSPVYRPFSERCPVVEVLPYSYDVKASCPLWLSFLNRALPKASVDLLRRYLSLALVDRRSLPFKVEQSLWLVGPGGAGKSTIMNTVRYVVGDSRVSSVSLGALLSGNGENRARFAAAIDGKAFNYCGEVQMEDMTRGSDTFKSLCSGEPQMMRRIGGNVEMSYEVPYLVFNMNRKPRNRLIDGALRRRLLFVTFSTAVRERDRDPELETKLRGEAAGIRNWLLGGLKELFASGGVLNPTESSLSEADRWMEENGQSVELFMHRSGYRPYGYTGENETGEWVLVKVLYDAYHKWCGKEGCDIDVDLSGMGRELTRSGYASRRTAKGMVYQIYRDKGK